MEAGDTRIQILDTMQTLIQTRGFHAVSYQDISDHLGIRKASIHYHFPSKLILGASVIERYRGMMDSVMQQARARKDATFWEVLSDYFRPFAEYAATPDKVCLCGALAGEFPSLPQEMQREVELYFRQHEEWVEAVLEEGRRSGEFRFSSASLPIARTIVSTLQGSLLLSRALGDQNQLRDAITTVRMWLTSGA